MLKLILEKAEEQEIKLPTSTGSSKKQESSRKTDIKNGTEDLPYATKPIDYYTETKILQERVRTWQLVESVTNEFHEHLQDLDS